MVLDLDETLIRAVIDSQIHMLAPDCDPLAIRKVMMQKDSIQANFIVTLRPHLKSFLKKISSYFTVAVYTYGIREYAAAMVDLIDPYREYICRVLSREDTVTI